jgi:hypothetical protein
MYIHAPHHAVSPCLYVGIVLLAAAVGAALLAENPSASAPTAEFLAHFSICSAGTGAVSALLDPVYRAVRAMRTARQVSR